MSGLDFDLDLEAEAPKSGFTDFDTQLIIEQVGADYDRRIDHLKLVTESGKDIRLSGMEEPLSKRDAALFKAGVELALRTLWAEFPISVDGED